MIYGKTGKRSYWPAATMLAAEVVAATKARRRQRDLWAKAEELLKEIKRWG